VKREFGEDLCPLCGGSKKPGKTTFTSDLGSSVVVLRNVPATVCVQCGAEWLTDETVARVERAVAQPDEFLHK